MEVQEVTIGTVLVIDGQRWVVVGTGGSEEHRRLALHPAPEDG